ncbi:MAG: hypothetical protein Q4D65_09855 [Peptostreptococcaceae bacterium]|nr:hypothetical protein [Peptostreptococcaceae bacterium]
MKFEKSQDEFGTTYKNEHIEVQIANNIENGEEIFANIDQDLNIINNFEPIENLEIIVEQNPPRASKENQVLIKPHLVSTDDFRKEIIAKSYNLYDQWKVEGIYGNLFVNEGSGSGKTSPNGGASNTKPEQTNIENKNQPSGENFADFQTYFQKNEFSLFSLRFDEGYSSEEEVENLKLASTDLVKYLLAQGKKEQLLKEEITMDDIKAWASEYEISTKYLESVYSHIENIRTEKSWLFLCPEIKTKRETNGFTINLLDKNEKYDTAKELEQIIKTFDEDIATNLQVIREQAPNFYKEFEKPLTEVPRITYIFEAKNTLSYVNFNSTKINLRLLESQMSEYNHILLEESFRNHGIFVEKPIWLLDGLDICLSSLYSKGKNYKEKLSKIIEDGYADRLIKKLGNKISKEDEHFYRMHINIVRENFNTKEQCEDNIQNRNRYIHVLNAAGIGFRNEMKSLTLGKSVTIGDFERMGTKNNSNIYEPNKLNLYANYSFVAYLLEEYGLEKMLYFGVQDFEKITFEEYFGKSYKELEADWKQYLIDNIKGGELLVYGEEGKK